MTEPLVILNFHGIGRPHTGVDDAERPYWIEERFYREIVDLVAGQVRPEEFGFTFDDGNISDLEIGAPALKARGLRGEFFILAGRIGLSQYLSASDCKALTSMGMNVGLHGSDHVDWRKIDNSKLLHETVDARTLVATATGTPVNSVAIPFGAYNRRVIAHLKRHGFQTIYTSDGGPAGGGTIRNRTSIKSEMNIADILNILACREPLDRKLRRTLSKFARRNLV